MNKYKLIEWSYPSSPNADRFGFKDGCWTVEIVTGGLPRAISGHANRLEALAIAQKMPLPWDPIAVQIRPQDHRMAK